MLKTSANNIQLSKDGNTERHSQRMQYLVRQNSTHSMIIYMYLLISTTIFTVICKKIQYWSNYKVDQFLIT